MLPESCQIRVRGFKGPQEPCGGGGGGVVSMIDLFLEAPDILNIGHSISSLVLY